VYTPSGGSILVEPAHGSSAASTTYFTSLPLVEGSPSDDLWVNTLPATWQAPAGFKGVPAGRLSITTCWNANLAPPLCTACLPGLEPTYDGSGLIIACVEPCAPGCLGCDVFGSGGVTPLSTTDAAAVTPQCLACDVGYYGVFDQTRSAYTVKLTLPYYERCDPFALTQLRAGGFVSNPPAMPSSLSWYWQAEAAARYLLTATQVQTLATTWAPSSREVSAQLTAGDFRPFLVATLDLNFMEVTLWRSGSALQHAGAAYATVAS
jgi:hypothetical protein